MDNLFLFTGEETYLLRQQISTWKKAFLEKHGDINLIHCDTESTSLGQIRTDIAAAPFLGDKRLIFIENLPDAAPKKDKEPSKKDEKRDEELQKFADELESIPSTSIVVFVQPKPDKRRSFYKKLAEHSQVKNFNPLEGPDLQNWIITRAQSKQVTIDRPAAQHLISLVGQNLWRLASEIDKLAAYKPGQPITAGDIDHLAVPTTEANIFHLTDALGAKNHKKAIENLHRSIAAGENLRQVFYMIVRQFRLFLQIGAYQKNFPRSNPASIASALKLHPFVVRNTLGQVKHFDQAALKGAYQALLDIDEGLKTSRIKITTEETGELELAIEKFMIEFCK